MNEKELQRKIEAAEREAAYYKRRLEARGLPRRTPIPEPAWQHHKTGPSLERLKARAAQEANNPWQEATVPVETLVETSPGVYELRPDTSA